jgi:acetolactate synthase I/II/III large subunit
MSLDTATSAQPRTVVEALAETMVENGCDHLFTLMGAGNLWLIHHLTSAYDVPVHHLRHENGAIGAADGYARSTGRLGWCTVTQGPGFTNTVTALLTADRGRSPIVLLVSDTSNLDPQRFPFAGGVQALPPEALLDPLGIEYVRAEGEKAPAQLELAAARAVAESRPIVFIMPAGLDKVELTPGEPSPRSQPTLGGPADQAVSPGEVARAADAIAGHDRVVVLAGQGAFGAEDEIVRLAELLGAPVATTVPAVGILGEHPAAVGPFGGFSIGETERLLLEADCIVAIGASLNLFQTRKGDLVADRTVVRIDRSPGAVAGARATLPVTADSRPGTAALADELARRGATPSTREPLAAEPIGDDVSEPGRVDPRTLVAELERVLPRDRRVFVDNGHFGAFPILYLRHRAPRSLVWMPDFGAVGSSLAAAFASAVADQDARAVLFIGDCGLYMTLGDLETVVREKAPLIVVCMNDGAAGSELAHMKDWGVPPDQAIFGYNDMAAMAVGMGAQAALVQAVEDVAPAVRSWDPQAGPLVLDCHISRAVRSPIYDHV